MAVNYVQNVIGSAAFSALSKTRGTSKTLTSAELTALNADVDIILAATHANATLLALEPGGAGTPQVQALRAAVESALDGVDTHGFTAGSATMVALAVQIAALYTASLAHMGSIS
jgi:hypothetical protein